MSEIDVSEFQLVAKEKHSVTLVAEQAHEVVLRHAVAGGGVSIDQSVGEYIGVYGLLCQS